MRLASGLLALSIVTSPVVLCAQSPAASAGQPLQDQAARYQSLSEDLNAMAQTNSPDAEIAKALWQPASSAFEYLMAGSSFLNLYDKITEPVKRGSARATVRFSLQHYGDMLDISTEYVNERLPHIQAPGVAQTALRLRDELRKGSDLLRATVVK